MIDYYFTIVALTKNEIGIENAHSKCNHARFNVVGGMFNLIFLHKL